MWVFLLDIAAVLTLLARVAHVDQRLQAIEADRSSYTCPTCGLRLVGPASAVVEFSVTHGKLLHP